MSDIPPQRPPENSDFVNTRPMIDEVVQQGELVAKHMIQSVDDIPMGQPVFSPIDDARLMTQGDWAHEQQRRGETQERHERELHIAQSHDNLTGLLNLQGIKSKIETMMETANEREFGILYIDLNGFKKINDKLGHDVGDELLVKFAEKLDAALRHNNGEAGDEVILLEREQEDGADEDPADNAIDDTDAARHGGDEFIAIINLKPRGDGESMSPRQRMRVIENRIREICAEIAAEDERFANFGAAIGSAVWTGGSSEEILREADHQMRADKPADSR